MPFTFAAGTVTIGSDLKVNRIGLGTNRISDTPEAAAVLKRAVELGVQFIDTADIYVSGESEAMIAKTLAPYPKGVVVTTKGGMTRDDRKVDGSPEHLECAFAGSMQRLKLECVDLYQLHRIDPNVPLRTSMQTLKGLQDAGKIRHLGLSNVSIAQIQEAQSIAPITTVQNHYNLEKRDSEDVLDYCEAHGIVFIPFFPLGGRASLKMQLLAELAEKYGATPMQLAIAWLLKRSPAMLPIPGTLSVRHLQENIAAGEIELNEEDFADLGKQ